MGEAPRAKELIAKSNVPVAKVPRASILGTRRVPKTSTSSTIDAGVKMKRASPMTPAPKRRA
jgi:hypothetical protein